MKPRSLAWAISAALAALPARSGAQVDPQARRLVQAGYDQVLQGRGPISGYVFYYFNQPEYLRKDLTLRLALSPVYVDSSFGFKGALGEQTDLELGVAGGGFADGYSEIRGGSLQDAESFTGHGGNFSLEVTHRFNPGALVPLYLDAKDSAHYAAYAGGPSGTDFALPPDQWENRFRSGLRWGGREPVIFPSRCMEISAWYEERLRLQPGPYGFSGDRRIEAQSHLFWGRALLGSTLPGRRHEFYVSVTAGGSVRADRLSAFRLGGALPLRSEFPLNLPGYYFEEISADRFVLEELQYSFLFGRERAWGIVFFGDSAQVDYLPGLEQPGIWNSGLGSGITFRSPGKAWKVILAGEYGLNAIRNGGRGAQSLGLLIQYDGRAQAGPYEPGFNPSQSRGLERIFR